MLKRKVGDVSPAEYDWRAQFGEISGTDGYVPMDAGKVHGLAVALDEAEKDRDEARAMLERIAKRTCKKTGEAVDESVNARLSQAERLLRWVRPFSPNDGTIRSEIDAFLQITERN